MAREQSTIGAAQYYGARTTKNGLPNTVGRVGLVTEVELHVNFTQVNAGLPVDNADVDAAVLTIPANSLIKRAYFEVGTAFTSTGSATLELGVQTVTGGTVDADGLDTIAVAALTAGSWLELDGTLIGITVGTAAVQISIDDAVEVFTAGTGRLVVEFIAASA